MQTADAFAGRWAFRKELSNLSTPGPRRWVKHITCDGDVISVREEIDFGAHEATVEVEAVCNGKPFPVSGSMVVDAMAYTRPDARTIWGTGTLKGVVSLTETQLMAEDGRTFAMTYAVFRGKKKVARGVAVFERLRG